VVVEVVVVEVVVVVVVMVMVVVVAILIPTPKPKSSNCAVQDPISSLTPNSQKCNSKTHFTSSQAHPPPISSHASNSHQMPPLPPHRPASQAPPR
jgi:hypothetical protein